MAVSTHTVKKGETLSGIASKYGVTWQFLANINNIPDPNKIYVGQVIKLYETASTGSGNSNNSNNSNNSSNSNKATIKQFGLQVGTDRTIFATWSWPKSNTKEYIVNWAYGTGNGVSFLGSESTIENKGSYYCQSTYTAPANATSVEFWVKPVSTTHKVNDKDVHYWTAEWSTGVKYWFSSNPPTKPPTPTVSVEDNTLTARVDNLDVNATEIQFQVVQNDSTVYKTGTATIVTGSASYSCTVVDGNEYKVRCRSKKGTVYSDWSDYSNNSEIKLKPSTPSRITDCRAESETSVRLAWSASPTSDTYDIEYATESYYLGESNSSTIINNIKSTSYAITGLATGHTYYFRVRAVNEAGESGWSEMKSTAIGTTPESPTTWSSTTTAIVGETVYLYWVHNSEDNSKEVEAELHLTIGDKTLNYTIVNSNTDEDENRSWAVSTKSYTEGTVIRWKVRTSGATREFGDWSVERTIDVYAKPSLSLNMTDVKGDSIYTLTSFPFYIAGVAGPNTQEPIGYHVSITTNEAYDTVDEIGNFKMVTVGQEVYSKFYDTSQDLLLQLTPGSIDLENNISYTINCTVTMNSGLTAEESIEFDVAWTDEMYTPNAEISFDQETLCAHIRPYCDMYPMIFYQVEHDTSTGNFYRTSEVLTDVTGTSINDVYTKDYKDIVYRGQTGSGSSVYFCVVESNTPKLLDDVRLSVYRREYDGRFVEIATNLKNGDSAFITDPHPALDYARYRVVAISETTGAVSYNDIPGFIVGEKAVIIQWDENWSSFNTTEEDPLEIPSWSGSMLKLPYNIDVSDSNSVDVSMVNYIGRSHPVSYYGTQLGAKATWNVDIPKQDKNTLYGLRKLAIYMGDVYVREPSGSGYWAHVEVSFNQTHCETVIPVTLNLTRVEGGV